MYIHNIINRYSIYNICIYVVYTQHIHNLKYVYTVIYCNIITIYNVYTCITIYNVYTCPPDQLIRQGSAQGLAGIRCYSFFLRNWLSGFLFNLAEELRLPPKPSQSEPWSTAALNQILQTCFVSDLRGINIHTFNTVEFESDLYRGVMRAQCYPFNLDLHRFHGRNVKVW